MLEPGAVVGILGSGQLGRMLSLAAARLGLKCHIYADTSGPAFDVAAAATVGRFDDRDALAEFGRSVDVATVEFENVPASALAAVARVAPVYPPPRAVEISQDRLAEKDFLSSLAIPVAAHARVDGPGDLERACASVGLPALIKTRHLGYDGKGQARIEHRRDAADAYRAIGHAPALVEALVPFEAELSVLAVRGRDGSVVLYDPVENRHEGGILAQSRVPAHLDPAVTGEATAIARRLVDALDYVGVLCVEMFCLPAGSAARVLVNEIAPRVHNSGHWTLDACIVSQFENHIRAVAGWPLGTPRRHSDAVMTNLIGASIERWPMLAAEDGAALHIYGKREARPGRKMGHVTRLSPLRPSASES